jgi:hypothetical protein
LVATRVETAVLSRFSQTLDRGWTGEILDVPISVARALVARIGNSPLAEIWVKRFLDVILRGDTLTAGETAAFKAFAENSEFVDVAVATTKSGEGWKALASAFGRASDDLGDSFFAAIEKIATRYGDAAVGEHTAARRPV